MRSVRMGLIPPLLLCILLLPALAACGVRTPTTATPTSEASPTAAAAPQEDATALPTQAPDPTATSTPPPTEQKAAEGPLTPQDVSVDPGALAEYVHGEIVPGTSYDPNMPPTMNGEPEHLRYLFDDYPADDFFTPYRTQLLIYPLEAYRTLYEGTPVEETFDTSQATLRDILEQRPTEYEDQIPTLPEIASVQVLRTRIKYLEFEGGHGVRFITYYAHDVTPMSHENALYTFQGVTDDGRYHVAFYSPIRTDALPDTYDNSPAADDYDTFAEEFERYLIETSTTLEALPANQFEPSLDVLDGVIRSLTIRR